MPFGIIGQTYTFHMLFVDNANAPVAVDNPQIEIYCFDKQGNKVSIVAAETAMTAVPNTVGEYIYLWNIPQGWTHGVGVPVSAFMKGTDPNDGSVSIAEETVTVTDSPVGWVGMKVGQAGIISRFIK